MELLIGNKKAYVIVNNNIPNAENIVFLTSEPEKLKMYSFRKLFTEIPIFILPTFLTNDEYCFLPINCSINCV